MTYPIYQTVPHNSVNTQKSNTNPLALNNKTIKKLTKENKFEHGIFTKLSNYCNEKYSKCGLDICSCKCSR